MAFDVGTLLLNYAVNIERLEKDLTQAQRAVLSNLDKIESAGKRLSVGITAPLVAFGGLSVKLASDAAEAASKTEAVFGRLTGDINSFLGELQRTVPATTKELQGFASQIQDLLVPLGIAPTAALDMSKAVLSLTADLSSFNNLRMGDVFRDIQSGLVGQNEPLLKYGVAITQALVSQRALELGLRRQGETLSASARAQAAFSLILERTTAAQGDAARTADSAANSFKFLLAEVKELATVMGDNLLPVITPIVRGMTELIRGFTDLPKSVQLVATGIAALAASIGPTLIAFVKLTNASFALKVALGGTAASGLLGLIGPQGILLVGLAALATAATGASLALRTTQEAAERLSETVQGLSLFDVNRQATVLIKDLQVARSLLEEIEQQNRLAGGSNQAITASLIEQRGVVIALESDLRLLNERSAEIYAANPPIPEGTPEALKLAKGSLDIVSQSLQQMKEELNAVALAATVFGDQFDLAGAQATIFADALERIESQGLRKGSSQYDDIQNKLRAATLQSDAFRRSIEEAGIAGENMLVPMLAVEKIDLNKASSDAGGLALEFDGVAQALAAADVQAATFFGRISQIVQSLEVGGAAGIAGAIGIGVGIVRSIFEGDPEAKRKAEDLRRSIDRLEAGVARLGREVLQIEGSLISGINTALSRTLETVPLDLFQGLFGSANVPEFERQLSLLGITMQDVERLARSLKVDGFEATASGLKQLQDALNTNFLEQALKDFNVQLGIMQARLDILGGSDVDRFTGLLDSLIKATSGTLKATLGTVTIENAQDVAADLLDQISNGLISITELGKIGGVEQLIQLLVQLDGLADSASGAASALNDVANVLNAPTGFKFALAQFNASEAETLIPLTASIGGGTSFVIEGDINVNANDPEELSRKLDESARRRSSRGGRTAIENTVNGTRY